MLAIIAEHDLSPGGGATIFLTSLLDHPDFGAEHLPAMPRFGLGGAPVPLAVAERAEALGIRITRAYGSTEHPSITGSHGDDPADKRMRTDGCALPGVDMRLVDEDGDEVAAGVPGEIVSRGPDLFVGYTDPALTAAAIDADGWYRTGDVGVLDDDGYLTITDRLSDIIIRGGLNLSASEIEERVATMPAVAEVAVVAAPDARLGERACAVVRLRARRVPGGRPRGGPGPPGGGGPRQAEVARGGARGRRVRPHPVGQDPQALPPRRPAGRGDLTPRAAPFLTTTSG